MKSILLVIAILVMAAALFANTLTVPTQFQSIQAAINAATVGDTVLVSPGSYFENINFLGKNIVVASNFINDTQQNTIRTTVICGNGAPGTIVTINSNETRDAKLIGFHVINGNANGQHPNGYGGGIRIYNSSPTISSCIIENNQAATGGGIFILGNPRIEKCLITENTASNGGGIAMYGGNQEIVSCTITENTALQTNVAGIFGGVYLSSGSNAIIVNSIIWENIKLSTSGYQELGNVGFCFAFTQNSIVGAYNNIQGGADEIETSNNGTIYWCDGNIDQNPMLDEFYNLQSTSPCIDSGYYLFYWNGIQIVNLYPYQYNGGNPDMGFWESNFPTSNNDLVAPVSMPTLGNCYPNPFNPETNISYSLAKAGNALIEVFNSRGQLVKTLVDEKKSTGTHNITWNGKDQNGNSVSSGIYFYRLKSGESTQTKKMMLMK